MYLVAELCGQHSGSMRRLEQMALQAKMAGADAVKVQLYDTYRMPGENRERWEYLGISFDELKGYKEYCDRLNLDLFASFFDEDRLQWCLDLDFPILKVASMVLKVWPELAEKCVASGRRVVISLGMYDWEANGAPYDADNVEYLYCLARYPGTLDDIHIPDFNTHPFFTGYSDHAPGNAAVFQAIMRGATFIEKHFTTSRTLQCDTEKGHFCAMEGPDLAAIRTFSDEYDILEKG